MKNNYLELDIATNNGAFTLPSETDMDMLALREYCKKRRMRYEDLSDSELRRFTKRPEKTKADSYKWPKKEYSIPQTSGKQGL